MEIQTNTYEKKDATGRLLDKRSAAKVLGICERTLFGLTQPRGPIPAVRIGARVLYELSDLKAFVASSKGKEGAK